MEFFFSLSFFMTLFIMAGLFFLHLSRFISKKIENKKNENAKSIDERNANKYKLLNAISVIHSAKNANTLNGALKDFYQSIRYHKTHDVAFYDRDLIELDACIEKFARNKALKLYGVNLEQEAYRDYLLQVQKSSL